MQAFRITRAQYASDLSGEGAALFGGRWNPRGLPLLYCANSTALAALEVFVHIDPALGLPKLSRVVVEVPDEWVEDTAPIFFADERQSQRHGAAWLQAGAGLCFKALSATLPACATDSFNLLVNPSHPEFSQVKLLDISPFEFDPRLF
ncbi:RES family NAD+ phosphorylase [Geoalkalibacter halelectricus]|uniref:RES domain-containing protein n=1 Tax=Geoalkalibacter halelectricus TaxID=2847045 RepID=A0ABY5ZQY9_9BACT|nr:RES domain-containing protein [Geoalkalibacter halelectricus]MDO3376533.1 RES domain-containing protein [Geoalkalibacter halelectricus]UWZ79641.1 RES domain-containing protein [Geoalkalibacter halelectricus]